MRVKTDDPSGEITRLDFLLGGNKITPQSDEIELADEISDNP